MCLLGEPYIARKREYRADKLGNTRLPLCEGIIVSFQVIVVRISLVDRLLCKSTKIVFPMCKDFAPVASSVRVV